VRRKRPDEARDTSTRRPGASTPEQPILALQRSAGNHAVTRMLSREEAPEHEPATVKLGDLGVIVLHSWKQAGMRAPGATGTGQARPGRDPQRLALEVTTLAGKHTPQLSRAAFKGEVFEQAAFESQGFALTLRSAMIDSYAVSSHGGAKEYETWTLSGEKAG
jgi:hypothetical protein